MDALATTLNEKVATVLRLGVWNIDMSGDGNQYQDAEKGGCGLGGVCRHTKTAKTVKTAKPSKPSAV